MRGVGELSKTVAICFVSGAFLGFVAGDFASRGESPPPPDAGRQKPAPPPDDPLRKKPVPPGPKPNPWDAVVPEYFNLSYSSCVTPAEARTPRCRLIELMSGVPNPGSGAGGDDPLSSGDWRSRW